MKAGQRPTVVTILALAFLTLGVLSFIWALLVFGVGAITGITGSIFGAENMASLGATTSWQGVLAGVTAIFDFVVAFGLFRLKAWGWLLAVIAVAVNAVQGAMGLLGGGVFGLCCGLLGLAIPLGILFYLFRPEVRTIFGR